MDPNSIFILDRTLAMILSALSLGYVTALPVVRDLLSLAIGISLGLSGVAWLVTHFVAAQTFLHTLIKVGLLSALLAGFPTYSEHIREFAVWGGLVMGGRTSDMAEALDRFNHPSQLIVQAVEAMEPIDAYILRISELGWMAVLTHLHIIIIMGISSMAIWIAHLIMAAHVMFLLIFVQVMAGLVLVWIWTIALSPISFMSERTIGMFFGSAARLGVAALFTTLLGSFVSEFFISTEGDPEILEALWLAFGCALLLYMSWKLPSIIGQMFFGGGPVLNWGDAVPMLRFPSGGQRNSVSHGRSGGQLSPHTPGHAQISRPVAGSLADSYGFAGRAASGMIAGPSSPGGSGSVARAAQSSPQTYWTPGGGGSHISRSNSGYLSPTQQREEARALRAETAQRALPPAREG